jgi:hypothetical protein
VTLEVNPNYPSDLDSTAPAAGDLKAEGDDHLRNIKRVLKTTLPNVSGAITPTHTQINTIPDLAPKASPAFTGTPTAPTAAVGTGTTQIATTAFVAATALVSALPGQLGNSGKFVTTDGTNASWARIGVTRSARTSNTILGATDSGKLIDITSGTFTQTFDAVATLADGWYCWLRNSGTGDITLDPNGAEMIDGLATYIMYPNEVRLVQCDGAALRSVVLSPFYRAFTATGSFVKPPGYSAFGGLSWSDGCCGQRTYYAATLSVGGGACGWFHFTFLASAMAASETVTIGAGGLAVTTVASGNVGGNTSLGSFLTVYGSATFTAGGSIGTTAARSSTSASVGFEAGGVSGTGVSTLWGGAASSSNASAASGDSVYGGGAGGGVDAAGVLRAAGTSKFGGSGGAASIAGNGTDGTAPGGGGGATQTGTSSGAGARGELRIWGIA